MVKCFLHWNTIEMKHRKVSEVGPMNKAMPKVSVIVPVYNGGTGLEQCLAAIRASTYSEYELIVVDNGSTDDSVRVASGYGDRILHCPGPSGPGAARNMGSEHATGDLLIFVDADVVVCPDTLSRLVCHFENSPNVSAVFGSYDDQPAAENFLSQYRNLLHHFVHQQANSDAATFWGGCGAIRKAVFHTLGGFDQQQYPQASIEDIELGFRLHQLGSRIVLDRSIQVKHLKVWKLGSMLRADILNRAVPWTKLILEKQGLMNDLNLETSQRVSAGLVGLSWVVIPLGVLSPYAWVSGLGLLGMVAVLNRSLYWFFYRKRGVWFALKTFPMQILYFTYSGMTFVTYWCVYKVPLLSGVKPKPSHYSD